MDVMRIADGLWRWTAPHPDWTPEADWDALVGCVYHEAPEEIVLVDPLVPVDEADRFYRALDRDVDRLRLPVVSLVTCGWHERSATAIAERYGGRTVRPGDAVRGAPVGVRAVPAPAAGEVVWWLEEAAAIVPGDTLLGDGSGGVRVCPASWLDDESATVAQLVLQLRPLLDLPIERVLVSHGAPVLEDGHAALVRALDGL